MAVGNYKSGTYGIRPNDEVIYTDSDWNLYASKQALRNPLSEKITADSIEMIKTVMPMILENAIVNPRKGVKIRLALTESRLQGLADPMTNTIIIDMVNGGTSGIRFPGVHILETLVHELVHSEQYRELRLGGPSNAREYIGQDGTRQVVNLKALYNRNGVMSDVDYRNLPWEREAFSRQVRDSQALYARAPELRQRIASIGVK